MILQLVKIISKRSIDHEINFERVNDSQYTTAYLSKLIFDCKLFKILPRSYKIFLVQNARFGNVGHICIRNIADFILLWVLVYWEIDVRP